MMHRAVERGCGYREEGGIYMSNPPTPFGKPIEYFLIDPPMVVNPEELGISPVGVHPFEKDGIWHVWDWVGGEYYPNVADFVEETRRFGLSRRISGEFDFSLLGPGSRVFLLHSRAQIVDYMDYYRAERPDEPACPKEHPDHEYPEETEMCAKLWWQDIERGLPSATEEPRKVQRDMPSFSYEGLAPPEAAAHSYELAAFMSMPIIQLEVINGIGSFDAMTKAQKSGLAVENMDA